MHSQPLWSRRAILKTASLGAGTAAFASCQAASLHKKEIPSGKFDALRSMATPIEAPDAADFAARQNKLREELSGAAALWITGVPSLRYFTGVRHGNSERLFGVLLFEKGDPIWICPAFEQARAMELIPKGQEIRAWQEDENPADLLGDILRSRAAAAGPLAVEPDTPYRFVERFQSANPAAELRSGFEIVRRCRMVKSEKEISLMHRANEITKRALFEASKHLTEGTSEEEFSSWVREAHLKLGAENPWAFTLFGPNSAFPHGTQNRLRLREGNTVLCDNGGSVHGYQSDVTRTWVFGKPSERQQVVWEAVKKAQTEAFKIARPGAACEEIDRAARAVIDEAGFGPDYKNFTHRLGHGIGLEVHEEPYLVRGNQLPLEPGMSASNEPGIYLYGEFGVRIEDIMVVTENGAVFLGEPSPSLDQPFGSLV